MTRMIFRVSSLVLAGVRVPQSFGATSTALDAYLAGVSTLRAEFTQPSQQLHLALGRAGNHQGPLVDALCGQPMP